MSELHPEQSPRPPDNVLSYRRPPANEPPRERDQEGLLGCLSTALLIPLGVVAIFFAGYAMRFSGRAALVLVGVLFAVPLAIGLALRKSNRWQSLAAGLLVGLGIAALLEGICFMGTWK
jgi:hypothetical protein